MSQDSEGAVLGRVWPQSRGRPEDGGGDSRLPPGRLPLPSRPVMLAPPWLLDRSGKPPTLAHRPHVWSVASWTGARGVRPQSRGPRSPCRRWPGGLCSLRRGRRGRTEVTASPPNRASSCVSRPRPCVRITWSDFKNCSKPGLDLRASIFSGPFLVWGEAHPLAFLGSPGVKAHCSEDGEQGLALPPPLSMEVTSLSITFVSGPAPRFRCVQAWGGPAPGGDRDRARGARGE